MSYPTQLPKANTPYKRRPVYTVRIGDYIHTLSTVGTKPFLRAIAIAKPRGIQQLGRIKGVGSTKLEAWGTEVLDVVNR